jgi:hypothetical protein
LKSFQSWSFVLVSLAIQLLCLSGQENGSFHLEGDLKVLFKERIYEWLKSYQTFAPPLRLFFTIGLFWLSSIN